MFYDRTTYTRAHTRVIILRTHMWKRTGMAKRVVMDSVKIASGTSARTAQLTAKTYGIRGRFMLSICVDGNYVCTPVLYAIDWDTCAWKKQNANNMSIYIYIV